MIDIEGITFAANRKFPDEAKKSSPYLLARLLLGTLKITGPTNIPLTQNINYLDLARPTQIQSASVAFADFTSSFSLSYSGTSYIAATRTDNRVFYRELLLEFSHFFLQTKQGHHVTAFVHLYRILERISYSVPLLYCRTFKEFSATFDMLKKLIGDSSGELGLFKKLVTDEVFIDKNILDTEYDISFGTKKFYKAVTTRFADFSMTDAIAFNAQIQFRHVGSLLVVMRNRFFHARTGDGQNNMLLGEIHDPDGFYLTVNEIFCSYLSIISFHILAKMYKS